MTIYRRAGGAIYSYDFYLDGVRHTGSTGSKDESEAREIERAIAHGAAGTSVFCRSILRRASLKRPESKRRALGYVYMIRSGYFVKIGYSADPDERIRAIRTSTPDDCDLLFCIPGNMHLERRLHDEFSACHYKKEWFFLCGRLKDFVEQLELAPPQKVPQDFPREASETA